MVVEYLVNDDMDGYFVTRRTYDKQSTVWIRSRSYPNRNDAEALRGWMIERQAGYPYNPTLGPDVP